MSRNLLGDAVSPYLLQHKDNPVHWRPWGPAALAEAAATGKPILLSVGYAACHWCHVMAHESFEDPSIADLMNRLFVNIKVDREERPDIDQIYMSALHALGETGGWPLTMFLTAAAEPVWGGTYFPPVARYGRPSFRAVLTEVARIFREEPGKVEANRTALLDRLRSAHPATAGGESGGNILHQAAATLLSGMDPVAGGLRGAPKFPQASIVEALWRAWHRDDEAPFRDAALRTLTHLCQGGIYDHLGGGLARYSVDDRWLAPHFEKMLYDNAQFIERLAHALNETGNELFRIRIEETIDWLTREMRVKDAFAASLDADSEGEEGRFYLWTRDAVDAVLGAEGPEFCKIYDVTADGNFEGKTILNRLDSLALCSPETEVRLRTGREKLRAARELRPRPARDDKVLADWNGLLIAAIALAGDIAQRRDWLDIATGAYRFIKAALTSGDGRIAHSWRDGRRIAPGFASDAAAMTKAALSLHAATGDSGYLADAETFARALRRQHWDPGEGGYFLSADDAEALVVRPKNWVDEATPNPNGLMAENLVRLWRLTGDDTYRADADAILAPRLGPAAENPFAHAGLLNALDQRQNAVDVVIVAPPAADIAPLRAAARRGWRETVTVAIHRAASPALPPSHPAAGKTSRGGAATAYVCRGETCSAPVTTPAELEVLLRHAGSGRG